TDFSLSPWERAGVRAHPKTRMRSRLRGRSHPNPLPRGEGIRSPTSFRAGRGGRNAVQILLQIAISIASIPGRVGRIIRIQAMRGFPHVGDAIVIAVGWRFA